MLRVKGLTKKYGRQGIENVSFEVSDGNILGIVGPNGVGKTTMLQCLAGILEPDAGQIFWNHNQVSFPAGSLIGYMPEFPALPPFFSPRQTILYLLQMRRMPFHLDDVEKLLEEFQLTDFADRSNTALSQGMQKRVMMAIAMMTDPQIILLDEPTNGLDTAGLILLKDKIRQSAAAGKVVLVSSHVLDFISAIQGQTLLLNNSNYKLLTPAASNDLEAEYLAYYGLR